ncbi:MAG: hypothetical protein WD649_04835, partial [Thermoleophilaceae bacterium]
MKRLLGALLATALLGALHVAPASGAEGCEPEPPAFGLCELDISFTDSEGAPSMQAGSHPFATTTTINVNLDPESGGPVAQVEDLEVSLPAGLVGNPTATPRCTGAEFFLGVEGACPDSSAVGTIAATTQGAGIGEGAVYNLEPGPGTAARFGFNAVGLRIVFDFKLNPDPPYNVIVSAPKIPQVGTFLGSVLTVWGNPADERHDAVRGSCLESAAEDLCEFDATPKPFPTLPRSCAGPLETTFEALSWTGFSFAETIATAEQTHGCATLAHDFAPEIAAAPTARSAESPTGLGFRLSVKDEGIDNPAPDAVAASDIKRAEVTMPEGVTINPSQAEGLAVCSEAELARETADSEPGEGCPEAAKIGTVEVETPLLEEEVLRGSLFVAEPFRNPFGSLLALYMTVKSPERGIGVRLAGKVEPDPRTGQLITTFGDPTANDPAYRELPQLPFSEFRLRFREGGRSPLVTPPGCGAYEVEALFTPWADPSQIHTATSTFQIDSGPGGGPCPSGPQPFEPDFEAGTLSNQAASHSPFLMRLTRRDGDQDLTRFDATLPR